MKKNTDPMTELKSHKTALWMMFTATAVVTVLALVCTIVLFFKRDEYAIESSIWFVRAFAVACTAIDLIIFCGRCEKEKRVFTLENMKLIDFIPAIAGVSAILSRLPYHIGNQLDMKFEYSSDTFIYVSIAVFAGLISSIFKIGVKMQEDLDSIA